jgi:hypothetical protein
VDDEVSPVDDAAVRDVRVEHADDAARRRPTEVQVLTRRGPAGPPDIDLLTAVEWLRTQVATLSLTLDLDDVTAARREREGLLSQLDDYLLPRLRRSDAPLLAVIGGSTGAGKSTLTNSIVGREVSRSGVLRPTTRSPVLVHHPYDSGAFLSQRILPRLTRVTSEAPEPIQPINPNAPRITGLRLVPHDGLTPGMGIIDAPDIDSLVETNRDLAVQLLQAADLWIFVTTAARYADAMPWQLLKQAADRGVAVAVVLDRVPPEALQDLRVHLATKLRDRGLAGAPLFAIPEVATVNGFLPDPVVAPLQQWLRRIAGDERARSVIAARTRAGVVDSLGTRAQILAAAAQAQADGWARLLHDVEAVAGPARRDLLDSLADGALVTGEVLARWFEFLADGEFAQRLEDVPATLADRIAEQLAAAVHREGEPARPLQEPVGEAVVSAVLTAIRTMAEEIATRWRAHPFGASLLTVRGHQVNAADQPGLVEGVEQTVRDWRSAVAAQTAAVVDKAGLTRLETEIDEQTVADVVFVAALDRAADDDGPRSQTAQTLAAARRIVGGVLGPETIRSLAASARADLVARAALVFDAERRRLEKMLESTAELGERAELMRIAAAQIEAVS